MLPGLPLQVPVPERLGRPGEGYPWHWSVVPWITGEPADRQAPTDHGRTARALGGFLNELHRPAPDGLPANPFRSGPLITRQDAFDDRVQKLEGHIDAGRVREMWQVATGAAHYAGPSLWLHGDLHPANLLVREGTVVAVIDFGDTCAGDPACDLGAAYLTVPPEHRRALHGAYSEPSEETERRAQGWALLFALMLLEIGLTQRPTYATVARRALRWLEAN